MNGIEEEEIMFEVCFWKWTLTNHRGPKLELALAKKLRCYHFSLRDEIFESGCG